MSSITINGENQGFCETKFFYMEVKKYFSMKLLQLALEMLTALLSLRNIHICIRIYLLALQLDKIMS